MVEDKNQLSSNILASCEKVNVIGIGDNDKKSNNKSIITESPDKDETFEPPDGSFRGWLVLLGAFLCNGVIFGIINTYSIVYLRLQKNLESSGDKEASSKAGNFLQYFDYN